MHPIDRKRILHLSIPAALNNFLDTVQLLVDMLMVGRLSPEAIAAVGLSGQLIILIYAFLSTFYTGVNALVSRFYGSGNFKEADKTVFNISVISFVVSLPFFIFTLFYNKLYFSIMGAEKDVYLLGSQYISILSYSIPFLFLGSVLYSALNASGDTKTPLFIGIFTNILNTFLNYCLIFGNFGFPALGVKGAAIATTVSYILEVFIYLAVFLTGVRKISFYPECSLSIVKRVLKVGIPAGMEKVFSFASFLIFVKIIALFGTVALAGYQIGLRIEGLAFMPGFGFVVAAMVIVGQSLGAGKKSEAEEYVKEVLKLASFFMGGVGLLLVIFPEYIANIFTDNKDTLQQAVLYLRVVALSQIPLAFEFVLNGALRGAGATKLTFFVNNLSFWFFRILPAYFLAIYTKNLLFVYIIMIAETFIKASILYYFFKKGAWKNIEV